MSRAKKPGEVLVEMPCSTDPASLPIPPMVALAVAVEKLGGLMYIDQPDLDLIATKVLVSGWANDGRLCLSIGRKARTDA